MKGDDVRNTSEKVWKREVNTGIRDVSRVILHATNLRILSDLLSRVTEGSVRVVLVCKSQRAKPARSELEGDFQCKLLMRV